MLSLKFIRENRELVQKAITEKMIKLNLDDLLNLDNELTQKKKELQELQTKKNQIAKSVPKALQEEKKALIEEGKETGRKIGEASKDVEEAEMKLNSLMLMVPNLPWEGAPKGISSDDNTVIKTHGNKPNFTFSPKDHVDILKQNNWAEFERVANVCGSRTYSLKGQMVFVEMAVHQLAMEIMERRGFQVISVPTIAREFAFNGTGHFPDGRDQVYHVEKDELFLTGTAEVVANSLHHGEILNESELPIRYGAFGPCFRREAGSAGKDVRGLIRVHQFLKSEQYILCQNDLKESEKWHQGLLDMAEEIMQALEIPYQIVECCTGDMGTGKYRMNDIEAWVPSEEKYRETHSCSSLLEWQARRSNLRYRNKEGKVEFCHTLNCTAIATPRVLVPLLENHQQEDGSVKWPKALKKYLHF